MDASFRSRFARWPVFGQALLVGLALGVLAFTGGALFLYDAEGLLFAALGVVVTLLVSLAVGLWAGAPAAARPEPPLRSRWYAAAIVLAIAGGFAIWWSLQLGVWEGITTRVAALLFLIAAPAYTLGLLLPSLLAWAEQREAEVEREEGVGGGEGGPWEPLGTLVMGALLGVVLGALVASFLQETQMNPGVLLLGTAAVLLAPTMVSERVTETVQEQVLYEAESPLSLIRVVEVVRPGRGQPERRLYVNDEEESGELMRSGAPTLGYIAAAEQWLAQIAAAGDTYLFLGGGAYTLPRRLAERDPNARITVVELDPEVTRAAYRFFGMRREHGIATLHGDARALIEQLAGEDVEFDRIFVDVYDGRESLPFSLVTVEAFTIVRRLLRAEGRGRVLLNTIGVAQGAGERRFWSIVRTLSEVFPAVALYTHLGRDYPERQNILLAAAPEPETAFPQRAGIFERWPREEWPGWQGTMVLHDLFPRSVGKEVVSGDNRGERTTHPW